MKALIFFILLLTTGSSLNAQPSKKTVGSTAAKAPLKKPSVKNPVDSFSLRILNAIKTVQAVATDPQRDVFEIAGYPTGTTGSPDARYYTNNIVIPGSQREYIYTTKADRDKGVREWSWNVVIATPARGTATNEMNRAARKLDSLLKTIPTAKETDPLNHIISIGSYSYIDNPYFERDSLFLWVNFIKPCGNMEQQVIDSLVKIYRGPMIDEVINGKTNFPKKPDELDKELQFEGISAEKRKQVFAHILRDLADKNMSDAYEFAPMFPTSLVPLKDLIAALTDNQRKELVDRAKKVLADYNNRTSPSNYTESFSTALRNNVTNGPAFKYKAGQGLEQKSEGMSFGGGPTQIIIVNTYYEGSGTGAKKKYTLAYRYYVAPKNSWFKNDANVAHYTFSYRDVSEEYLAEHYTVTSKTYAFCPACNGTGVTFKTQTRKAIGFERVADGMYRVSEPITTAQWQEAETCRQCWGLGTK